MNLTQNFETELAARLEHLEHGASHGESRVPVTPEIVDLLQLAHQLRMLPPVEPNADWLDASKQRLMARFGAPRAQISDRGR